MRKLLLSSIAFVMSYILGAPIGWTLPLDEQIKVREKALKDLSYEYESIMIYQYYKSAFENIPIDPISGGGEAEKLYKDLLLQEHSKIIAKNAKLGVADSIYEVAAKNDSILTKLRAQKNVRD